MAMNEQLCLPVEFAVIAGGTGAAANLSNDRLGRVANVGNMVIDLGFARPIDTFALLATNATNQLWRIRAYATQADAVAFNDAQIADSGTLAMLASSEGLKRLHRQAWFAFPAPVVARWWVIEVSANVQAGRLIVGQAFTAVDTMDVGYSFKVYDYGTPDTSPTGLDNPTLRGKALEYSWVWSWMTEQEARGALLDLLAVAGNTRDILCVLNPDAPDLHNVIAYGKLVEEVEGTNIAGGNGIPNAYEARFRVRSRLLLNL